MKTDVKEMTSADLVKERDTLIMTFNKLTVEENNRLVALTFELFRRLQNVR